MELTLFDWIHPVSGLLIHGQIYSHFPFVRRVSYGERGQDSTVQSQHSRVKSHVKSQRPGNPKDPVPRRWELHPVPYKYAGSTAAGLRPTASYATARRRRGSTAARTGRASLAAALNPCRNALRHACLYLRPPSSQQPAASGQQPAASELRVTSVPPRSTEERRGFLLLLQREFAHTAMTAPE
jgi:hypothetical protein